MLQKQRHRLLSQRTRWSAREDLAKEGMSGLRDGKYDRNSPEVWEQSTALKAVEQPVQRGRTWSFKKQRTGRFLWSENRQEVTLSKGRSQFLFPQLPI